MKYEPQTFKVWETNPRFDNRDAIVGAYRHLRGEFETEIDARGRIAELEYYLYRDCEFSDTYFYIEYPSLWMDHCYPQRPYEYDGIPF